MESILDLKQKGAAAAVPGQRRVRWLAPVHTIGSDEHPFIDKFVQIFDEVCCQGSYEASFCHPSNPVECLNVGATTFHPVEHGCPDGP